MSAASTLTNAIGLATATAIVCQAIISRLLNQARGPLSTRRDIDVERTHRIVPDRRTVRIGAGLPFIRRRRMQQQLDRALPDVLDLVVVLLQAGATPRQTVIELSRQGPRSTQQGFAAAARQLERGQSFGVAVDALRRELGEAITPFVELITASERYGLPTAQVVQQLSSETRALRRRHDEAAARSLPVKLSFPLVMCTLPSFVLLAIAPAVLAALSSLGSHAW